MSEAKFDITSTVVEKGIDLVKGFVEKLVGSTLAETGLLLGDNIRIYRLKKQIKTLSEVQQIAKDNNISIKQISLKTLLPLLEYSSLEEDETLQEKWTNLFVNYIDANEKYESTIFPFILNQLTSNEVIELERIYKIPFSIFNKIELPGITKSNFIRLGLMEVIPENNKLNSFTRHLTGNSNRIKMTELGREFVKCCSPKNKL